MKRELGSDPRTDLPTSTWRAPRSIKVGGSSCRARRAAIPVGTGGVLLAIVFLVVGGLFLPALGISGVTSSATPPPRHTAASSLGLAPSLGATRASPDTLSPAGTSYYRVVFNETTLPGGKGISYWSVQLGGDFGRVSGTQVAFSMPNGTYSFVITPVSGYLPRPSSGSVTVAGANQTVQIVFRPAPVYPLTFRETGLPAGGFWYVNMLWVSTSSRSANQTYLVSNGTYPFTLGPGYAGSGSVLYPATPSNGTVVINGSGANVSLTFLGPEYLLTFTETGLPSQTTWFACVTNLTKGTPCTRFGGSPSLVAWVPNGTYGFTVEPLIGFSATPASGTVRIAGAPSNSTIAFSRTNPWQYAVVFNETGLPASVNWTVTLNGTSTSATGSSLIAGEPNGTYAFSVPAVTSSSTAYNATPSQGNVTVAGATVVVKIAFSKNSTANATPASPLRILLFQVSPADVALGQQATVSVTTSGGTGPLTYSYTGVPVGCAAADRATWTCTPTSVGTSKLAVQVRDASGATSSAGVTLVVHGGTPHGPALLPTTTSAVGIGVVVVLGLAGAAVVWSRRTPGETENGPDDGNPYRVTDLAFGGTPNEDVGPIATRTPTPAPDTDDPLGDLS